MPENVFDERVARVYDATSADRFDPAVLDPTVDFLAEQARGGDALELGIGTGRVALPLAARGVRVHGIDISEAMLAELAAKPGAGTVDVMVGDFATAALDRTFRLAYLVYNTITNLITQDEQVECFRNVARHLEPGGRFVIEVGIPQLRRLPPGETTRVFTATPDHVGFDAFDVAAQIEVSHHYFGIDGELQRFSSTHRFVWPAELDLMARLAGMHLVERWSDWNRAPFTSDSDQHVSVWEKPA
ncbi:MAG: class I SAM-dependent DNA methyltransferase [Acidimicrobiia bacterium]